MTKSLSILSYNIHKGFSPSNRRFTLQKIKTAIRTAGADLVFLQEVQGEHKEKAGRHEDWPSESQFEFLADSIWTHHAYGKNAVYDAGHHGNALLSKFPIVRWENFNVSTNTFEQRGILHSVVNLQNFGTEIHALCLHFNIFGGSRTRQLKELCRIVTEHVPPYAPLVVAGDFNDWSRKASSIICGELSLQEAFKVTKGSYAKTFPSQLPFAALDRIYFRGFRALRAEVLCGAEWKALSDHAALMAVLEID